METKDSLNEYTADDLRNKLKAMNLTTTGNKDQLVDRFLKHQEAAAEEPHLDPFKGPVEDLKDLLHLADGTIDTLKKNRYFTIDQLDNLTQEDLKDLIEPLHDRKELQYYLFPEFRNVSKPKPQKEQSPIIEKECTPIRNYLGSRRPSYQNSG